MRFLFFAMFYIIISNFFILSVSFSFSKKNKGIELYHSGKYQTSLLFLEKAFKKNPLDFELSFYLANAYSKKKFFKKASHIYLQGLELSPKKYKKHFLINLAYNYQRANLYQEALRIYSLIKKYAINDAIVDLHKSVLFFKLKDKVKLIKSWNNFLLKQPNSIQFENIRRAIAIIKSRDFKWNNNNAIKPISQSMREEDKNLLEDKLQDDTFINDDDIKLSEDKLFQELLYQENNLQLKKMDDELEKSLISITIDSVGVDDLELPSLEMQEGQIEEFIER